MENFTSLLVSYRLDLFFRSVNEQHLVHKGILERLLQVNRLCSGVDVVP